MTCTNYSSFSQILGRKIHLRILLSSDGEHIKTFSKNHTSDILNVLNKALCFVSISKLSKLLTVHNKAAEWRESRTDFGFQKEGAKKPPQQIKQRAPGEMPGQYFLTRISRHTAVTEHLVTPDTGHSPTYLHKRLLVRSGTIENLNIQGQSSASHCAGREDCGHERGTGLSRWLLTHQPLAPLSYTVFWI